MFYLFTNIIMDSINTTNRIFHSTTKSNKLKNLWLGVMLFSLINFSSAAEAQNISKNSNTNNIESPIDVWNNKEKIWTYNIPDIYKDKIYSFLKNDFPIMGSGELSTWMFTIDFALKEMESDRWISKDNQWLFVWHAIYGDFIDEDLYDIDDGDSKRLKEFDSTFKKIEECWKRYKEWFTSLLDKISAEARERTARANEQAAEARERTARANEQSAEYDRRTARANEQSAIAIKEAMSADTLWIKEMVWYYKVHEQNPKTTDKDRLKEVVRLSKIIVDDCKKRDINYRDIIQKEVEKVYPELKGTEIRWKVDSIINFYEGGYDAVY